MAKYTLPFGADKDLTISIPDSISVVELGSKEVETVADPVNALQEALESPIGNVKPLSELIEGKKSIVVVVDDYTRKFPRDSVLIPFFTILEEYGIEKGKVTILMGTGTHAAPDKAKLEQVLGTDIPKKYKVEIHDHKSPDLVDLGVTSRGTPILINKTYHEADCKILLTDVSYHYYAGFGGDRKEVLPAVSGEATINHNHGLLIDPNARTGNLAGNPVHLDMMEAARKAGADFVVNAVVEGDQIIAIKAGELGVAFEKAVEIYKNIFEVPVEKPADMVIVSAGGYPKDIDLYQGTKGLTQTMQAVKKGGQIIYLAECKDGIGHKVFEEWIQEANAHVAKVKDPAERLDKAHDFLASKVKTGFKMGGHKAFYMTRERKWDNIAMLSSLDAKVISDQYFVDAVTYGTKKSIQKELQAFIDKKIADLDPKLVYVIPHGGELLVTLTNKLSMEKKSISSVKKNVLVGPPFITKYEKSRIVGARALQLSLGAPPLISDELITPEISEPINIAEVELEEKVLPIIIRRVLPSKEYKDYPIDVFTGDASAITRDVTRE